MIEKKTGFGTRTGFALAAAGSAIGLGNLWGFPYKISANGGSAYLFVYIACIILIGAVEMMAEFAIGRRAKANTVSAFRQISPALGWAGLLAVVIPFLILCYYLVLGSFATKFALNAYAGNSGSFHAFSANFGDVVFNTLIFAFICYVIVAAGIRRGIEKAAKILMPTVLFFLILIVVITLMLGEGVSDGIAYYLRPDFSALTPSAVLSAMGHAFFSMSLGCGIMIAYGSYSGDSFDLGKVTATVCVIDIAISFLMGFAVFPAVFHYSAVSGMSVAELGLGDFSLMFVTMSMVFEDVPYIGSTLSMLFFVMAAIAAVTSAISLMETVTQYIIQRWRIFRSRAAFIVTAACFVLSIPVAISLGASLNDSAGLTLFGKDLFTLLDLIANTILMPVCALLCCIAAAKLLGGRPKGFYPVMVSIVTPAFIVIIELFGIYDTIMPHGSFSQNGLGIVLSALALIVICAAVYFLRLRHVELGCNADELSLDSAEAEKRRAGLPRTWVRPENGGAK